MKRFIYEIYYKNGMYHATEYWNAKNYREAKKEIMDAYSDDYYKNVEPCTITMIAEIRYEDYSCEE